MSRVRKIGLGALGVIVSCCICVGGVNVADRLGLMPEPSPTLPSTHTPTNLITESPTDAPVTSDVVEEAPSPTDVPTVAPTATPTLNAVLLPIIQNAPTPTLSPIAGFSCIPLDTIRQEGTVINVIDGDTIEVQIDGTNYKLRYIGMDTPESGDPFSIQATNKNSELVSGKSITMVKDVSETDQYDRLLRYVFVGDIFVNYYLVQLGLAEAGTWPPDTACDAMFSAAEQEARSEDLGIWAPPAPPPPTNTPPVSDEGTTGNIVITSIFYDGVEGRNEPDEYVEIRNDGSGSTNLSGWLLHDEESKHDFRFPDFEIEPGAVCRVYTNENHPEYCGFNFHNSGSAIWNNGGDCAYLYDSQGNLVNQKCY